MADPRTESRTETRPIREDDRPVTMSTLDPYRSDRLKQSDEDAFNSGSDTSVIDRDNSDRDNAVRNATQDRTPLHTATTSTAAAQSSPREWENGPTASADQTSIDNIGIQPLFSEFEIKDFRSRWNNVQAGFVDSPRHCVQEADELVADVLERLTTGFSDERNSLEKQWDSGGNVSTEDLRVALQRYRSFFGRLLNAA